MPEAGSLSWGSLQVPEDALFLLSFLHSQADAYLVLCAGEDRLIVSLLWLFVGLAPKLVKVARKRWKRSASFILFGFQPRYSVI